LGDFSDFLSANGFVNIQFFIDQVGISIIKGIIFCQRIGDPLYGRIGIDKFGFKLIL
jgi:hypothetical protein